MTPPRRTLDESRSRPPNHEERSVGSATTSRSTDAAGLSPLTVTMGYRTGSVMVNSLPSPVRVDTLILPCSWSRSSLTRLSPSPTPGCDLVDVESTLWKRSNIWWRLSLGMPGP